jgi:hypothetical protein
LRNDGASSDKGLLADPHQLMNSRVSTEPSTVLDMYMPCERRGVCHANITPKNAVVPDMGIGHQEVAIPKTCAASGMCSAGNAGIRPYNIPIANLERLELARPVDVLRSPADVAVRLEDVARPNLGSAFNHGMRMDLVPWSHRHFWPDHRERMDVASWTKLRALGDESRSVDEGPGHLDARLTFPMGSATAWDRALLIKSGDQSLRTLG